MDNQPPVRDNWEKLLEFAVLQWRKFKTVEVNFRKICLLSALLLGLNYAADILFSVYSFIHDAAHNQIAWYSFYSLFSTIILSTPLVVLVVLLCKFDIRSNIRPIYRVISLAGACYVAIFLALPDLLYLVKDIYYNLSTLKIHPFSNGSIVEQFARWFEFSWPTSSFLMDFSLVGTLCAQTGLILLLISISFQRSALPISSKHAQILRESAKIATLTACISIFFAVLVTIVYTVRSYQQPTYTEQLSNLSHGDLFGHHLDFWLLYTLKAALSVLVKFIWALPAWVFYRYFRSVDI